MKTALRVLRPGVHSTVQDLGRLGYRNFGVPRSGALDGVALRLLNALLGNDSHAAAIEMMYSGMSIELAGGTARVAVACAQASIKRASGTMEMVPAWHTVRLAAGDRLSVGAIEGSAVAYLGVEGGYDVPSILGSASTYVQGALGGFDGRAFKAGDGVGLQQAQAKAENERRYAVAPRLDPPDVLRVMYGPQADAFTGDALDRLVNGEFRVTPASNRTGARLEGPVLTHAAGHDLLSEGVATGSIQVPGSGQPVILLSDHPTVGGYPKIATVIAADLSAAGRLRIGGAVRFALADETQAADARRGLEGWIAATIAGIGP